MARIVAGAGSCLCLCPRRGTVNISIPRPVSLSFFHRRRAEPVRRDPRSGLGPFPLLSGRIMAAARHAPYLSMHRSSLPWLPIWWVSRLSSQVSQDACVYVCVYVPLPTLVASWISRRPGTAYQQRQESFSQLQSPVSAGQGRPGARAFQIPRGGSACQGREGGRFLQGPATTIYRLTGPDIGRRGLAPTKLAWWLGRPRGRPMNRLTLCLRASISS